MKIFLRWALILGILVLIWGSWIIIGSSSSPYAATGMMTGFSVLAVVIGMRLLREVTRPLAGLEREAQATARSDSAPRFDAGSIFAEIQTAAESVKRMTQALRSSEDKYRRIFTNIQDGLL